MIIFGCPKLRGDLIREFSHHFPVISSQAWNFNVILDLEFCLTKQIFLLLKFESITDYF